MSNKSTVLTVGIFDGVHRGHRSLVKRVKEVAIAGYTPAIVTFTPHPRAYLSKKDYSIITDDEEKSMLFEELSVHKQVFLDFNESLLNMSAADFVKNVLIDELKAACIIVGENHSFGRNKEGTAQILKELCFKHGVAAEILPSVLYNGDRVSSAKIRKHLENGSIEEANELLASCYFIRGEVVKGDSLGRMLGFPTINLSYSRNKLLPKKGVYFTKTGIEGQFFNGITNVGIRPTIGGQGGTPSVETFLFNFNESVYGKTAKVYFIKRQRDEMKFNGLEELTQAIERDKQDAMRFFSKC
jgi:riboflavin kinase/FMN adenylyltransferase